MLLKLLEALEKNVIRHECAIYDILCDYNGEETGKKCECDCVECRENLIEQIIKLREQASKQTVKPMELDALYSLKDKFVEKYNVLFNKYALTEAEQGELRATTEMLYSIDDIVEKQARENKTSDTQKDNVNHPSHYNAHKHECIDEMIAVFGVEAVKHFCMCNAWKYRYRAGAKDGEEDLKKSDWYIEKLMELGQKRETKLQWKEDNDE